MEAVREGADRHELVLPERHNVRAALDWAADADPELGLRLAVALENFWVTRGPHGGAAPPRAAPRQSARRRFDPPCQGAARSRRHGADGGPQRRLAGRRTRKGSPSHAPRATSCSRRRSSSGSGSTALFDDDFERGRALHEDSLERFRALGDTIGEIEALGNLGWIDFEQGERERGWERTRRSLEMSREARWKWWEGGRLAEMAERSLEEAAPRTRSNTRSSSSRSRARRPTGRRRSPPSRSWRGQRPSGATRRWPSPSGAPSRSRNACGRWRAGKPFATATRPRFPRTNQSTNPCRSTRRWRSSLATS